MREVTMQETRDITRALVELRKERADDVKRAQAMLKQQQAVLKMLERAMQDGPRSVPQLAAQTGIPAHEILQHIASMKKYAIVAEAGMDESGDYFLYSLTREAQQ
jgi:predicted Rossmann fold nucleotide-binding protein DprA/Smf involved in DNA uptake